MTTASIKPYIERLIGTDDLDDLLLRWDAQGLSPNDMAKKIHLLANTDDGKVHKDTVRRWVKAARLAHIERERLRLESEATAEEQAQKALRQRRKAARRAARANRKPRAKKATA